MRTARSQDELVRRLERETSRALSLVVCLMASWFLVIGALLVSCGDRSPVGTVTSVDQLASGTYQLETITGYRTEAGRDAPVTELVNAGTSTACQVGEVWPSCD